MDSTTAGLDFAAIGHQDSWQNISAMVNSIRNTGQDPLSCEKIKRHLFLYSVQRAVQSKSQIEDRLRNKRRIYRNLYRSR